MTGAILQAAEFACAFCKGTGVVAKTHSQCPVCRGQKSIKVAPPAMVCAYCRGRGEASVRSGITCIVCLGKGVVSVQEPLEACPACRGRGAAGGAHLPCTTCRGKGVITVRGG
ncbi:MAG: hypothetical protein Q8O76_01015 [Chloroflexota bacterium]|nr:hypothetical protein [Chloroflexota bacterium]